MGRKDKYRERETVERVLEKQTTREIEIEREREKRQMEKESVRIKGKGR